MSCISHFDAETFRGYIHRRVALGVRCSDSAFSQALQCIRRRGQDSSVDQGRSAGHAGTRTEVIVRSNEHKSTAGRGRLRILEFAPECETGARIRSPFSNRKRSLPAEASPMIAPGTVSYTHLTLPTILLV